MAHTHTQLASGCEGFANKACSDFVSQDSGQPALSPSSATFDLIPVNQEKKETVLEVKVEDKGIGNELADMHKQK